MKILYYCPEKKTFMGQWQRVHIFDELQRHGVEIKAFNPLFYTTMEEACEKAVEQLKSGSFDLFFTCHCNTRFIPKDLILRCKELGIPSLSVRYDNYVIPFQDEELSPLFDLVWITSQETKYLYDKFGAKTIFAPYAANPYRLTYKENLGLIRKACFIGTPHSSRANLINKLTRSGIDVDAFYGNNTNKEVLDELESSIKMEIPPQGFLKNHYELMRFSAGRTMIYAAIVDKLKGTTVDYNEHMTVMPKVSFEELPNMYSQYAIALAFTSLQHTDVLKNPVKIVDLRNFEIPMSGGIEFCRFHAEMASYFEENKEIIFYNTDEELRDKAKYYINNATDSELRRIKSSARKRAETEHTWWNRFTKVFDELELKY